MTQPYREAPDLRAPQEIDAAWLTRLLQGAGIDAEVARFDARPIGSGQIGDSVRFSLRFSRGADVAPATIVGKFPSADPDSFNTGVMLGNYVREVEFYRRLAPTARVSTPEVYGTALDDSSGRFVLMMEDLAPAEQGDQLQGVGLDQARLVVDEAAKLHGSHWGDPAIEDLAWVSGTRASPPSSATPEMVQALWAGFRERYGPRLSADCVEVGEQLTRNFQGFGALRDGPKCLTHNDYRPDNMMFATPAGGKPVTVLDWQSVSFGTGAVDVAYFLAGALTPEQRRAAEPELLARYLDGLKAQGVDGYGMDDLKRDYAGGGFLLFLTAFFAAMIVKRTDRGDDMFMQMLSSGARHVLDHDALSTLA